MESVSRIVANNWRVRSAMRDWLLRVVVMCALLALVACTAPALATVPPSPSPTATSAPPGLAGTPAGSPASTSGKTTDTAWMVAHLDDPSVRVIDVDDSAGGFARGHLPGATLVSPLKLTDPRDPIPSQVLSAEALSALFSGLG